LTSELSETLKLWPGYVYWARGQLKLAADTFAATIDALKHCKETQQDYTSIKPSSNVQLFYC